MWPAATFHCRERCQDARIVSRTHQARLERLRRQEPLPGAGQSGGVRHRRGDGWSAALSG
jgi:hypothetical protein